MKKLYALFGSLYSQAGFTDGFIATALLFHLQFDGDMSRADAGKFVGAAAFMWTFKFVCGALVDRFKGHHLWIVPSVLLGAVVVGLCSMFDGPSTALLIAVLVKGLASSIQDTATDGLSVHALGMSEKTRSRGQLVMRASSQASRLLGGAGMVFLTKTLGWDAVCYIAAGITVLLGVVIPCFGMGLLEASRSYVAEHTVKVDWREVLRSFKKRTPICALILGVFAFAGIGMLGPLFVPFCKSLGYNKEWGAIIMGGNDIFQVVGVVVGGILATKLPRKKSFALAVTLVALSYMILALYPFVPGRWGVFALMMGTGFAEGIYFVHLATVFMDVVALTRNGAFATTMALFMASINVSKAWTPYVGGLIPEDTPFWTIFLLVAVLQLVVLIPLAFMDLRDRDDDTT